MSALTALARILASRRSFLSLALSSSSATREGCHKAAAGRSSRADARAWVSGPFG